MTDKTEALSEIQRLGQEYDAHETDIVGRLRSSKQYDFKSPEMQRWQQDRLDAADEIERLREALLMISRYDDDGAVDMTHAPFPRKVPQIARAALNKAGG